MKTAKADRSRYQRAWVDFFEDQLVVFGYDWKKMLEHFLYEGENPLINAMACSCKLECPTYDLAKVD